MGGPLRQKDALNGPFTPAQALREARFRARSRAKA
jgi:hypothetical protein